LYFKLQILIMIPASQDPDGLVGLPGAITGAIQGGIGRALTVGKRGAVTGAMVGSALGFFAMPPSVNYAMGAMLDEMLNPTTLVEYIPMYSP
jgi:hypothetical protein